MPGVTFPSVKNEWLGKNVLFVSRAAVPTVGSDDALLILDLQAAGFIVTVIQDITVTTADATGRDLVFVSSSVTSANVNTKFLNVTVPVATTENAICDDMNMCTTNTVVAAQTQVALINTPSPFSAGDSGNQTIYPAANTLSWMNPNTATAFLLGTIVGQPTQYTYYAYRRGAIMAAAFAAPARRGVFSCDMSELIAQANAKARDYAFRLCVWALYLGGPA